KITCTAVLITSHLGDTGVVQNMKGVAEATGGRFYDVRDPTKLPAIYIQESRLVSRSFVYDKKFSPALHPQAFGPVAGLPARLDDLYGFVRTQRRPSELVEVPIDWTETVKDEAGKPKALYTFPILAHWQYGLGKVAAFTSDAKSTKEKGYWDRDWANS